ncbi:hypothetical protein EI94DRAFT_1743985 [Lactarius quietus]|nr:hypothetical protein EI94DRAFT_1743985 [Lactarius quietus]
MSTNTCGKDPRSFSSSRCALMMTSPYVREKRKSSRVRPMHLSMSILNGSIPSISIATRFDVLLDRWICHVHKDVAHIDHHAMGHVCSVVPLVSEPVDAWHTSSHFRSSAAPRDAPTSRMAPRCGHIRRRSDADKLLRSIRLGWTAGVGGRWGNEAWYLNLAASAGT